MINSESRQCTITLSEAERSILVDILEELLRVTLVEEHRTEAFRAKEVVQARERAIESLLQKARVAKQN